VKSGLFNKDFYIESQNPQIHWEED